MQVFIHKTDSESFPNERDKMGTCYTTIISNWYPFEFQVIGCARSLHAELQQRVRKIVGEQLQQTYGHSAESLGSNLNFQLTRSQLENGDLCDNDGDGWVVEQLSVRTSTPLFVCLFVVVVFLLFVVPSYPLHYPILRTGYTRQHFRLFDLRGIQ